MKFFKISFQIILLIIVNAIGNGISKALHLPIPGSIVGLILLFLLLQFRILKVEWIDQGAAWLLGELILFFIPSAVGVINYGHVLGPQLTKLVIVIVLGTLTVMTFTGLTAQLIGKRRKRGSLGDSAKNR